ncbi:ATP-grasp domain-containing protein [Bernardetia sp. ABR2-2B]|uniref:ATP-grasp domain-containing protein n=1 Tax=Bernardetia sp. ABR2-2B TaxID=3127472 RepID=UPI0030CF4310
MKIIYCDSIIDPKVIDSDYEAEQKAAQNAGFETYLLSFEKILEENIHSALRFIPQKEEKEIALYRGWMLKPKNYALLYSGLLDKNIQLINSPKEYEHCHYLPNSYSKIKEHTPLSNWLKLNDTIDFEQIYQLTSQFGESPIIIKDYVKSEKYYWEEACFIPNAADKEKVKSSVEKFIELRGKELNEGLVFRKFEKLEFLKKHSKSSLPLTKELRIFFLNKKILTIFNYWEEGEYGDTKLELEKFIQIAQHIKSIFFTMDIAQKTNGEWIIIELGDGQVSELPDNVDKNIFYTNLREIIQNNRL